METRGCPGVYPSRKVRFEPTYKEWKREEVSQNGVRMLRFEPTYKEWKQ